MAAIFQFQVSYLRNDYEWILHTSHKTYIVQFLEL